MITAFRRVVFHGMEKKRHGIKTVMSAASESAGRAISKRNYSTPPIALDGDKKKKRKKVTVLSIEKKYRDSKPISMITCYDFPTATAIEDTNMDIVLVGDSAGMVVHGHQSTVPVSLDDIITHSKAVKRGTSSSFVIGDMPFGTFEVDPTDAVRNAMRLVKEADVDAIKLEGGVRMVPAVEAITRAGIVVMGHIGLTPQSASAMGGFRVQGKTAVAADKLLADAKALEKAGCFAIVVEGVPPEVASYITENLQIPTIGIGAGPHTSGQVLVLHDMIGLNPGRTPKFCKRYANTMATIKTAVEDYISDVETKRFPSDEYCYKMPAEERTKLAELLGNKSPSSAEQSTITMSVQNRSKVKKTAPLRRIAVVGGGAMGSFMAACLARLGSNRVWVVSDWHEHVKEITENGLRFDGYDGAAHTVIRSISATSDINTIVEEDGKMDLVFILVKSPCTAVAASKAAQLVNPETGNIITLQNGVGNRNVILEHFNCPERVIQGVTAHGAMLKGLGHVEHTGLGNTTLAVPNDSKLTQTRVQDIASLLTVSGMETSIGDCDSMEGVVWGKLVINAGINPLSALYRVNNGVLAENATCREMLEKTVAEAANVAYSQGITLPFCNPIEMALQVARNTAMNQSSMLCDVLRGVKTEIDAINGAVVRAGAASGATTEINQHLIDLVQRNSRLVCA
eukprot:TRINITY_DN633_c0_g1_i1.p1 TRINITY_DN633_c0_g1~~TRINITY_DN633_c0_g1_i1.p1  ORF type:complete len:683 (+),score=135.60 TRINITY_DN633_c0_g1_i1:58-2106(+)